ncbi:nicotinamide-nucleotide adenylyltransferase [Candidatus Woesearchaeota archaeon CG10_big_fil_rev_8_21_14_0_10_45_16]|nr:MAG: nicotinamide-nucleotide adenylyltransferase [Candidatus Woesearchaeota archaeon CG10_big_fil_rev_8_21_14_0_10_45_16]
MRYGLFIGRFQPFHKAHLQDIKDALEEVDFLYIGIGSSQESGTENNPYSKDKRKEMIKAALKEEQISQYKFLEIPDFNDDQKWVEHIESKIPQLDLVFTGNDWTERCFKERGYQVNKITLIPGITATIIRNCLKEGKECRDLLPEAVVKHIFL